MNLARSNLFIAFLLMLIPSLLFPGTLFPVHLLFFAPFLIIVYYKKTFVASLWTALLLGLLVDLLSSQERFGLHALNYCLTTWLLQPQKRNFFSDSLSTLPLMTFFFSILSSIIQVMLLYFLDRGISLSWLWVATDLLMMPFFDAIYAFVWFVLPLLIFSRIRIFQGR